MTCCAPPAAEPSGVPPDIAWHRSMLHELAGLAMDAARLAHARLAALPTPDPPTPIPTPDHATAGLLFTRLARAVRQTIALDARLAAAEHCAATNAAAERARRARTDARRHHHRRADLRRRLVATLRDTADPSDTDSLLADLDDRLDDDDIQAALRHTPPARIVLDLCAEWGITPNFATWSDDELAAVDPAPATPRVAPHPAGPPPPRGSPACA